MYKYLLILILLYLSNETNILGINIKNYKEVLKKDNNKWFIFFGSKTCPYCMSFLSIFKKLSDKYYKIIKFGAINCYDNNIICDNFKIKEYPTLYLIEDEHIYQFEGIRNHKNLSNFIEKNYKFSKKLKYNKTNYTVETNLLDKKTNFLDIVYFIYIYNKKFIYFILVLIILELIFLFNFFLQKSDKIVKLKKE